MRAWLTELRCSLLYVLRPRLCALEDCREALAIFKLGVVKRAKVAVKELKSIKRHELDD
jgi:hypothetical protein